MNAKCCHRWKKNGFLRRDRLSREFYRGKWHPPLERNDRFKSNLLKRILVACLLVARGFIWIIIARNVLLASPSWSRNESLFSFFFIFFFFWIPRWDTTFTARNKFMRRNTFDLIRSIWKSSAPRVGHARVIIYGGWYARRWCVPHDKTVKRPQLARIKINSTLLVEFCKILGKSRANWLSV